LHHDHLYLADVTYASYLHAQDDSSGRQQWTFTAVAGGYTIEVLNGRPGGCGTVNILDLALLFVLLHIDTKTRTQIHKLRYQLQFELQCQSNLTGFTADQLITMI
jgi:hypothetical protein